MKKILLITFCSIASIILLASFGEIKLGKRDGTEPGHTGSPGDTLKNCTICHGGVAFEIEGWITSDVPSTGYVPGQRYTITATNTNHGGTRFGFQVSPQALNGTLLGTLMITDTVKTKLVGDNKYVTYRTGGVDGQDSLSWTWDWIAPAAGTGKVIFYGAFNSNPGHKGGDNTYLSTLTLLENSSTGIKSVGEYVKSVSAFPNPANNYVTLGFDITRKTNLTAELFDMNGKKIEMLFQGEFSNAITRTIETGHLASGNYFIKYTADGFSGTKKIIVAH